MRNPKRKNAMENNIELFDRYIDGSLGDDEKLTFDERVALIRHFVWISVCIYLPLEAFVRRPSRKI